MSLGKLRDIHQSGVTFKSHLDGTKYFLSPEISTEIQNALDATISMQLDECIPFPASFEESERAMKLSLEWAIRSREAFEERDGYGQFGIVQGSTFKDLRKVSAENLIKYDFHGYISRGYRSFNETCRCVINYCFVNNACCNCSSIFNITRMDGSNSRCCWIWFGLDWFEWFFKVGYTRRS